MENDYQTHINNCKNNEQDFVTVIIKVVDYCNFECAFCRYYLDQDRKVSNMSFDTFEQVLIKACEYNISRGIQRLTVIFHGGEPLLWGLDNFKNAIRFENNFENLNAGFHFFNDIQTNGSLINDEWAEFFSINNFSIGVSIDGPDEINFHKSDKLSSDVVLNNIKCLSRHNCKFGILTVITEEHAGHADDYYDFLVDNGIHSVGFCYCFDPNEKDIVSNHTLSDFLTHFFDRYFYGNYRLHIREFEFVMKLCLNVKVNGCTFDFGKGCGNYFSILPNGDICFCDSYNLNDKALGNIYECDFKDIKQSSALSAILSNARVSAFKICESCEINTICGGGCTRHILLNGQHAFCDTYKVLYPYINKTVQERKVN